MSKTATILTGLLIAGLIVASQAMFIVPETKQTLVLRLGDPVQQHAEPGLKFKIPFFEQLKIFDSRVLDVDPPPEELILADQKRLVVDTFARYRIANMLEFHKAFGTETEAVDRIYKDINSTVRSTLGNVTLPDILSEKRAEIMRKIQEQVNASTKDYGIQIVDVRIGRADLPEQISKAVFLRMVSEREREAAEFRAQGQEMAQQIRSRADRERTVLLAEAKKEAQIIRGEGDEKAIKIYADAFEKDPEFYSFYRSMEAYRAALGDDETTLVLSPDSDFFRFFGKREKGVK